MPAAIRAILAATDLTEASDEVLRAAGELARRAGAALHVVHAFDLPPSPYLDRHAGPATFQARIEAAERALEAQLLRTVPAEVAVAGRKLEIYAAHRAILDYAEGIGADLLVLGPHTRRRVEFPFLGTTADRVARGARAPVLIVRGPLEVPFRRAVVPIDLSERSGSVLDLALAWGEAFGARAPGAPSSELAVVHVVPDLFGPEGRLPFSRAGVLPDLDREVGAALERAGGAAPVEVRVEVLWGEQPASEIVAYARENGADLVILATHGHGAVARALIGGTASAVTRAASCSVLLLPPRVWRAAPTGRGATEVAQPGGVA